MIKPSSRYDEIIIASAKLFRERGYLATSIRDIGEALGITSAALYYHFKNKEEVLLAIILRALKEIRQAVETAVSKVSDPEERVHTAMRTHLRLATEFQDFAIVWQQETRHLSAEALQEVGRLSHEYDELWGDLFRDARAKGIYREAINIRLIRLLLLGAMNQVVTWYRPEGRFSPEQIADQLFLYARDGVLKPDSRPAFFIPE